MLPAGSDPVICLANEPSGESAIAVDKDQVVGILSHYYKKIKLSAAHGRQKSLGAALLRPSPQKSKRFRGVGALASAKKGCLQVGELDLEDSKFLCATLRFADSLGYQ